MQAMSDAMLYCPNMKWQPHFQSVVWLAVGGGGGGGGLGGGGGGGVWLRVGERVNRYLKMEWLYFPYILY